MHCAHGRRACTSCVHVKREISLFIFAMQVVCVCLCLWQVVPLFDRFEIHFSFILRSCLFVLFLFSSFVFSPPSVVWHLCLLCVSTSCGQCNTFQDYVREYRLYAQRIYVIFFQLVRIITYFHFVLRLPGSRLRLLIPVGPVHWKR